MKTSNFKQIRIGDYYFIICVRVSARNKLNGTWTTIYLSDMKDVKDFDSLFPTYHRPNEDQFHWVVRAAKKALFKTYVVLKQLVDNIESNIVFNNRYECEELLRLFRNEQVVILDNKIFSCKNVKVETMFEPYAVTFVAYKWCKFRIGETWFVGRTYLTDKFNQDAERIIGCVMDDGGTQHKKWDKQKFDEFEYIEII